MSKGKEYFNTLLIDGVERILAKGFIANPQKTVSHTRNEFRKSSDPVKLSSYITQKSKNRFQDGKSAVLRFVVPAGESQTPKKTVQVSQQVHNPLDQRLSKLKAFVRNHIDSEQNYLIFQSTLKSLQISEDNEKTAMLSHEKSSTSLCPSGNNENPLNNSSSTKMIYGTISPPRLKKICSNPMPQSSYTVRSRKNVAPLITNKSKEQT